MCVQLPDLLLFALQRAAPGRWLVRAPYEDPLLPAVVAVAAVEEPDYAGTSKWQAANTVVTMRPFPPPHGAQTWAEFGDVNWRSELLECARLLDRLVPDHRDPELFHLQKDALAARAQKARAVGEVPVLERTVMLYGGRPRTGARPRRYDAMPRSGFRSSGRGLASSGPLIAVHWPKSEDAR